MGKKSKTLLPKRIGKVKVGKSVRKSALADVLTSKAGQALIAQAVLAAGTAAAVKLGKARKGHDRTGDGKTETARKPDATADMATFTYALGEAVRSFSAALHRPAAERAATADGASWAPLAPSTGLKPPKSPAPRPEPSISPPN